MSDNVIPFPTRRPQPGPTEVVDAPVMRPDTEPNPLIAGLIHALDGLTARVESLDDPMALATAGLAAWRLADTVSELIGPFDSDDPAQTAFGLAYALSSDALAGMDTFDRAAGDTTTSLITVSLAQADLDALTVALSAAVSDDDFFAVSWETGVAVLVVATSVAAAVAEDRSVEDHGVVDDEDPGTVALIGAVIDALDVGVDAEEAVDVARKRLRR